MSVESIREAPLTVADLAGPNGRRLDLEGDLTLEIIGQQYVVLIRDARLSELLTFQFEAPRDKDGKREFGRVRLTVERIEE